MNSKSVMYPIIGKVAGVKHSTLGQINKTITYLGRTGQFSEQNQSIRVKLTGDGTSISRSMQS